MKREKNPKNFFSALLLALLVCFIMQSTFFFLLDWKSGKGESNYFSTLSRFQAAASTAAEIALAGSSITGRLPGREMGNDRVANLGSDGGPALDGVRMLVSGKIPLPQTLIIETNTLYGGVGYGDSLIARNADSSWFMVGARMPLLGASARPSSMIYNALLQRKKILIADPFVVRESLPKVSEESVSILLTSAEVSRLESYRELLQKLREKGVNILFIRYPAGVMGSRDEALEQKTVAMLAASLDAKYLNLAAQIPREQLEFTDSVHLGQMSAARLLVTLQSYCRTIDKK